MNLLKNLKIGQKISLPIILVVIIGVVSAATLIFQRSRDSMVALAEQYATALAAGEASKIKAEIEVPLDAARTLAQAMQSFDTLEPAKRRIVFDAMLRSVLEANPSFLGVWSCWEPDALDGLDESHANRPGSDASGRYIPYWNRGKGSIAVEPLVDYDKPGPGDYYQIPLRSGQEAVIEPYLYSVGGQQVLITSLVVPIKKNGRVVGVAGVDMAINDLQDAVATIKPFGTGVAAVFSQSGIVAAHFDATRIGQPMRQTERDMVGDHMDALAEAVAQGRNYSFTIHSEKLASDIFIIATPIAFGHSSNSWSFVVGIPLDEVMRPVWEMFTYVSGVGGVVCLALIGTILLVSRSITRPLAHTSALLKDLSAGEGDLTKRLPVQSRDEMGELVTHINAFLDKLHSMVSSVKENALQIAASAKQFTTVSGQVARHAEQMSGQTSTASAEAARQKELAGAIAGEANQMADSSVGVAAAVEEMNATIGEVARSCAEETRVAQQAEEEARKTRDLMARLGESAEQIGTVVNLIDNIAEQTSLLSLNAAIEAASAGEAGRGFAVVAGEVKELARQTAEATQQIALQIREMQNNARESIEAIGQITDVIGLINTTSQSIAAAVEEQNATTKEISRSVSTISSSTQALAQQAQQSASSSEKVATSIQQLSTASAEVAGGATEFAASSEQLAKMSAHLQDLVGRFKL